MTQKASIGRIVHYALSDTDATRINARRTDGPSIQERLLEDAWPVGAQAHIGSKVAAGDVLPAMIVAVQPNGQINAQVFLDGNDVLWVTSRDEASEESGSHPGRWHWPQR
ncbi:TPA: hypothetical protein ACOFEF_000788 [Stenotrophomonas maltophilia]|uniref:hypothetical protein n=1 Tax=Stenotrophomonas maltophilia TaxID=40324 RepID=UPI000E83500D|nr:hypothetical protein [Stenotrophomonas maltophilia]HBC50821.1 hypothetical protein [Stenotrophomonas maltophilia]HDS1299678.1 hypothetical protein [Stenotrophomonas maltophilia]